MNIIEEYLHKEKLVDKKIEITQHVTQELIELHNIYPYVRIEDLVEIYYAGMNRTWTEIRTKANTNATVPSEEGNDANM